MGGPFRWRGRPPWWPEGHAWPHHGGFDARHPGRARFFRTVALIAGTVFLLATLGVATLAWLLTSRAGLPQWAAPVLALIVFWAAAMIAVGLFGAMRRFGSPLGAVMDAADRVAGGDYTVRISEWGPPPIRALARSFNTMTERLQHADRQRRDLMADVAHELRTPLTVLRGRLEGLLDGVYPRDDEQLSQLVDDTRVLSRLIDDLRTLALSDAGVLPLQKEPTDIAGLAADVVRSLDADALGKGITLGVDMASSSAAAVDLDPVRIREVLTNLLSNAIRHTRPGGTVTLHTRLEPDRAVLSVSDTGEGMAPDEAAHMFDRFFKGADSRGSGLGLTIARGLVHAHGGEISATSQPGHGTTVTVVLPR
jgi:signal transduction histidine kinase